MKNADILVDRASVLHDWNWSDHVLPLSCTVFDDQKTSENTFKDRCGHDVRSGIRISFDGAACISGRFLVVKLGVEGFFEERGKSYGEKNQDCCDYAAVPFGRRDADIHECPGGGEGQGEERKGKAADL